MAIRHDAIYKALADEHRRAILARLYRGPLVAGELAQLVGLAPNALSFHLKWLKSAGLVSVHREGRFLRYRANPRCLEDWKEHVTEAFQPPQVSVSGSWVSAAATRRQREPTPTNAADETLPTELL